MRLYKVPNDIFKDYGKYKETRKKIILSENLSTHSSGRELELFYDIANTIFSSDFLNHIELIPDFRVCLPSKGWYYDDFGMLPNNRCYFFITIDNNGLLVSCDFYKLIYCCFFIEDIKIGVGMKIFIFNQYLQILYDDIKKIFPKYKTRKADFYIYARREIDTKLLKCMALWLKLMSKKEMDNNIKISETNQLLKNRRRWKVK